MILILAKSMLLAAVMDPESVWLIPQGVGGERLQYAMYRPVDPSAVSLNRYLELEFAVLKTVHPVAATCEIEGQTLVIANEGALAAANVKNAVGTVGRLVVPLQEVRDARALRCTFVVGRPGLKVVTDLIVGLIGAAKDVGVPLVGNAKGAVETVLKALPAETTTVISRSYSVGPCKADKRCEGGFPREGGILLSVRNFDGITEEDMREARLWGRELRRGQKLLNVSGVTVRARASSFPSRLMEPGRLAFESIARGAPIPETTSLGPGARADDTAWLNETLRRLRPLTTTSSVANANNIVALDQHLDTVPQGAEVLREPFEARRDMTVKSSPGLASLVKHARQWAALATKLSSTQATCDDLPWLDLAAAELDSTRSWFDGTHGDGVAPAVLLEQKRTRAVLTCVLDEVQRAEAPASLSQVLLGNQSIASLLNLSPAETVSSIAALRRLPERQISPRVREVQEVLMARANTIKDLGKACAPLLALLEAAARQNPTTPARPLPKIPIAAAELESFLAEYEYWRVQLTPVPVRGEGVGGGLLSP